MGMTGLYGLKEEDFLDVVRNSILNITDPEFGAVGDDATLNDTALNKVIAKMKASTTLKWAFVPHGDYRFNLSKSLNGPESQGISFTGVGDGRPSQGGCSRFKYMGTGAAFEIGADDGQPYDANLYNGPGDHKFENIAFFHGATDTALLNTQGNYKAGSYALRDWRGGGFHLFNVRFENFHYAFWGINSDVNRWYNVLAVRNKVAFYFGPRSDQFVGVGIYGFFNDTLIDCDRAQHHKWINLVSVGNGSATTPPIKIHSEWAGTACKNIVFDHPWIEHYQLAPSIPSRNHYFEIGVGQSSTSTNDDIHIINPTIKTAAYTGGANGEIRYLARVERGQWLRIKDPADEWINLQKLVEFVGNVNTRVSIKARGLTDSEAGFINNGTGTPTVTYERFDAYSGLGADVITPLLIARRNAANPNSPESIGAGFAGVLNARTAAVVENDLTNGAALAILAKNTGQSILYLGDQDSEIVGQVQHDHTNDSMKLVAGGFAELILAAAGVAISDTLPGWAGGTGNLLFIKNVVTPPSTNPSGGGIMYVEAGALKYKGTAGTVTTLGPA